MSKTNINCDNSDHNSFYSAYDNDFIDQEQCYLLFHTWNLQTNMLLANTPLKDIRNWHMIIQCTLQVKILPSNSWKIKGKSSLVCTWYQSLVHEVREQKIIGPHNFLSISSICQILILFEFLCKFTVSLLDKLIIIDIVCCLGSIHCNSFL